MVRLLLALYAVVFLGSSLLDPTYRLWGINHLYFLPSGFSYLVAVGFLLLLLLPDRLLQKWVAAIDRTLWPRSATLRRGAMSIAGIGTAVLFWLFRSDTLLLGDGQIILNDAGGLGRSVSISDILGMALQTRTPLSTLIYFLAAQAGRFQLGLDVTTTLQLISCFAGAVFVMTVLWFLGWVTESARARVAGLGLLLFTGAIMLSFGYVEYYPLFFLSTFLYAVIALRWFRTSLKGDGAEKSHKTHKRKLFKNFVLLVPLRGKIQNGADELSSGQSKSLLLPGVFLLLSILLHIAASVLIPSFIFLLLLRYGRESARKFTRPKGVLIGISVLLLPALAWWIVSGTYELRGNFLPIFSLDVRNTYTLFSLEHIFDYANMLMLLCGAGLLVVIPLSIRRGAGSILQSPSFLFLIIMTVFQQLFVFAANTDIGFGRDWDVMISMGAGLLLLLFFLFKEGEGKEGVAGSDAIRFSGVMLLTVLPWIGVNASGESAASRFESLLEMDKQFVGDYRTAYGYEVLAIHWRDRGNALREQRYFGKAIEASDNIRFYENAVISLNGYEGKPDPNLLTRIARRFHRQVLMADSDTSSYQFKDHLSMYYVSMRMMRENGLCTDALPMYREAVSARLASVGYAQLGMAQCLAVTGERDSALRIYNTLDMEGLDIVPRDWEIMGEVFLEAKEFAKGTYAFGRALNGGRATEPVYFGLYKGFVGMGDSENARRTASLYRQHFPSGQLLDSLHAARP